MMMLDSHPFGAECLGELTTNVDWVIIYVP